MSVLDRRQFLQASVGTLVAPTVLAGREPERGHVALYLYARSQVRPRHRDVVRRAIERRSQAHTSGWGVSRGKPVLELGPVKNLVRHWKGQKSLKSIWAGWPFAAVLEFSGEGRAYLDCFRRARGSRDPGAWSLDPGRGYVEHINAETVCQKDGDRSYMAVVDTPTGDLVGGSEFVLRGRVERKSGATASHGWWIRFDTPRNKSADRWRETLQPLVDWRANRLDRRGGVLSSAVLEPGSQDLAVWGTPTVFRFPQIPPGIEPCVSVPR